MTTRLGRYEILRPIASGGMATVHLGRVLGEGGFERLLAIKVLHPHLLVDRDFVSMFLDEARLAASIRHPHVVSTIDVQRTPEALFLVMDYIEGPTLQRLIKVLRKRGMKMPIGVALRILLDTLAGLEEAHNLVSADGQPMNIVHRDVSPSNVLVGKDGITLITDFGVARAEARISSTRGGELKGKIPYMAPEQLSRGSVDRRVDVYAAGVVLWETLTLERLFRADDNALLLAAVLAGPQRSPNEVRPDVPWQIDRTCMRALEGPDDRFKSAAAFADALEEAALADGVRIAKARDVAQLVRELFPVSAEPGSFPSQLGMYTPASGSLPQALSLPPPSPSQPPRLPGAAATARMLDPAAPGDTNPTTHASVEVATPSELARARMPWGLMTLVVAVSAATIGGLAVWLAVRTEAPPPEPASAAAEPPIQPAAAPEPKTTEASPAPRNLDADEEPTPAPTATASAVAVSASAPPKQKATKPRLSPPPPPPPPPTSTAFRPSMP